MNTQSLNDGPNAVTVGSSFAPQQQEDASSWGTRALPKLAFLAEMTVEAEVQAEREEAALAARRAEELSDDVIVIDDASPTNLSDAEKESNDEEVQDHDESSDDDEFGEEYERKVEVVIARLARYGPSIFVQKTVQKHQTMAALADTCPRATKPSIYPPRTVKGLPEPVVLSTSTPGMDAHWSGVGLEPDPPQHESNPSFQKTHHMGQHPLGSRGKETPKSDSGGERSTVRGRASRPPKSETSGGGVSGSQLWLGRVKGTSSGGKRKHGSVVTAAKTTATGASAGEKDTGGKAGKTTAAEKMSTGQQKVSLVRTNEVLRGGKAAASSSLGGSGDVDATAAANHHHQSKSTEEARLQQVRQLLWAQSLHGAAEAPPVVPGALQNLNPATETNAPVTRNAPRSSASETQGNATSDNPNSKVATTSASKFFDPPKIIREKTNHRKNNLDGICRVNLTVNWKARTRSRSDMQPPSVKIVTVDVYPGEICARFISRMVQMPPGGAYNDTQLSWGSFVLQPTQVMEEYYNGSWVLNLRSEPPPELVLVLPVGSLLVHPALCNAAGWRFCVLLRPMPPAAAGGAEELEHKRDGDGDGSVKGINNSSEKDTAMKPPMKRSKQDDLLIDGWVPTKKALKAAAAAGITAGSFPSSSTLHQCSGSEDKELKVLSNRALHPGRTDPKRMAEVLREYRVIVENEPCSIVDVGSGDGYFVNGLIKAFPQACLCGIECQRHLYEESVKLVGRNANFLLGTAETQLAQCLSASVIIATTHNFDVSTIVSLVRCAARLPAVTHLVLGESRLCTPRCKAICGPCCCFEPLGTEDIPTYWGNSCLSFTVYRRVVPWMLEVNEVPRVIDEATLAALHAGELDPQIRQMGAGAAEARAMAGAGAGVRAAAVALHGVGLPGAAGDAAGGGGGERGVHSGERRPRAVGHASYEAVRMAAAKLQRNVHPPEKFSDHDMKVRRHKYPSRAERKAKDALDSYYEWEPEDDAADAGDGGPALTSALEVPNSKSTTGIVGRLLKLVGVQEA